MATPRTSRPSPRRSPARRPAALPARADLVARLRAIAPGTRAPALLGAPLTDAKLAAVERRLGAPLPEPLRGFVRAVGNGGVGRGPRWLSVEDAIGRLAVPADASAAPPFAAKVLDQAVADKRTDEAHVLYDPDGDPPPLRGVLPLADAGEGAMHAVLVKGKHAGRVWLVGEAWSPVLDPRGAPIDFLAWYLGRLEAPPASVDQAAARAVDDPAWPRALRAALAAPAKTRKLVLDDLRLPAIPDVFDRLPALEELSISHSTAPSLPPSMAALAKLRSLWLTSMGQLTSLDAVAALPQLASLHLGRSSQIELTASIAGLTALEVLILSFTRVRTLPAQLAELPRLHRLDLDMCSRLELGQAWPVIARMPALRTLTLARSRLLEWPARLGRPRSLTQLDLTATELPPGQLDRIRAALPGVTIKA